MTFRIRGRFFAGVLLLFILVAIFPPTANAMHTPIVDGDAIIIPSFTNNDQNFLACFKITSGACVPGTEQFAVKYNNTQYTGNETSISMQKAKDVQNLTGIVSSDSYWCSRITYNFTTSSWLGETGKTLIVGTTANPKSPTSAQHTMELASIDVASIPNTASIK